jgi:hypothetical protein
MMNDDSCDEEEIMLNQNNEGEESSSEDLDDKETSDMNGSRKRMGLVDDFHFESLIAESEFA